MKVDGRRRHDRRLNGGAARLTPRSAAVRHTNDTVLRGCGLTGRFCQPPRSASTAQAANCDYPSPDDLAAATRRRRGRRERRRLSPGPTAKGERQARAAGGALAALGIEFDACPWSPQARSSRPSELTCESLGVEVELTDALRLGDFTAPTRGVRRHLLARRPRAGLPPATAMATGGRVEFKKGGLAALDDSTLAALLRPASDPEDRLRLTGDCGGSGSGWVRVVGLEARDVCLPSVAPRTDERRITLGGRDSNAFRVQAALAWTDFRAKPSRKRGFGHISPPTSTASALPGRPS